MTQLTPVVPSNTLVQAILIQADIPRADGSIFTVQALCEIEDKLDNDDVRYNDALKALVFEGYLSDMRDAWNSLQRMGCI